MTNSTDTLWMLSAKQLIKLLEKKEVSPKEILESNINRINEVNPSINAVVTLCVERAKDNILNKDNSNTLLKSIPFLVKDVTDKRSKKTYGSSIMKTIHQINQIY